MIQFQSVMQQERPNYDKYVCARCLKSFYNYSDLSQCIDSHKKQSTAVGDKSEHTQGWFQLVMAVLKARPFKISSSVFVLLVYLPIYDLIQKPEKGWQHPEKKQQRHITQL